MKMLHWTRGKMAENEENPTSIDINSNHHTEIVIVGLIPHDYKSHWNVILFSKVNFCFNYDNGNDSHNGSRSTLQGSHETVPFDWNPY